MDELHVIMMSYRGSRGAVPSPVYKADPLSRLRRSRARIPAGLEAELSYRICIVLGGIGIQRWRPQLALWNPLTETQTTGHIIVNG